jgi:hypothetical protein
MSFLGRLFLCIVILFGLPIHLCSKIGQTHATPKPTDEMPGWMSWVWLAGIIVAVLLWKGDEWLFAWKQHKEIAAIPEHKFAANRAEIDAALSENPNAKLWDALDFWAQMLLVTDRQLFRAARKVGPRIVDIRRELGR